MKNKRKKYAVGTSVKSYVQDPYEELQQNKINIAKAKYEAETSPLVMTLKTIRALGEMYGGSMIGAMEGSGNDLDLEGEMMAQGGMVEGNLVPVEVEGGEVVETPQGALLEFFGAGHEEGGIPADLPEGTEVFSKRIKVDGDTMADRKKERERRKNRLKKLLVENPSDKILRASMNRTNITTEQEEARDMGVQMTFRNLSEQPEQFETGGIVDFLKNLFSSSATGSDSLQGADPMIADQFADDFTGLDDDFTIQAFDADELLGNTEQSQASTGSNFTGGDAVSLLGNMISTFGPYLNTLRNRSQDTPNINHFENFGEDALNRLGDSKAYVDQITARQLQDLELNRNAQVRRNNNSARSVNVQRALNLATDQSINNEQSRIYSDNAARMMQILSQQAQLENVQDQAVMSAEERRDIADRMDNDNFYTQLAQDITSIGTGLQDTGGDLNTMKERDVVMNLLNQLSQYGIKVDSNGNLITDNG